MIDRISDNVLANWIQLVPLENKLEKNVDKENITDRRRL